MLPWERMMDHPIIKAAGDSAVLVIFGDEINKKLNDRVRSFDESVMRAEITGIAETVPSYCADLVYYDPEVIGFDEICQALSDLAMGSSEETSEEGQLVEIPVVYGGEYGPDLKDVAQITGLTEEEVIDIHTSMEYPVYMLGFTPGFPYLGGMDERIACPRLEVPRTSIPAGSVGIAGSQTGVYPSETPGGWRIIGRTPLKLYDLKSEKPILLEPGMRIRFKMIREEEASWE